MKRGPEKIEVSSAENGFVPQQQIETPLPQAGAGKGQRADVSPAELLGW